MWIRCGGVSKGYYLDLIVNVRSIMLIADFNGQHKVETLDQMLNSLRTIRKDGYGAFILAHDSDGPMLWIHINGVLAYVHFFPDGHGNHPGSQPWGMTPVDCPESVRFYLTDGTEGGSIDVRDCEICSTNDAYAAAADFYSASVQPKSIKWTEL